MNEVARAKSDKGTDADKQGLIARIVTFFKQVFSELKKVQRPTQEELWRMFLTVLAFLLVVMAFVLVLDIAFSKSIFWIFG